MNMYKFIKGEKERLISILSWEGWIPGPSPCSGEHLITYTKGNQGQKTSYKPENPIARWAEEKVSYAWPHCD